MTEIDNFKEDCTLTNISGIQQTTNFRQSRSSKHFKNPPQPHMCIQSSTDRGEDIFINVLSWTRIVEPKDISDPIPLYGGMRVILFKIRFSNIYSHYCCCRSFQVRVRNAHH